MAYAGFPGAQVQRSCPFAPGNLGLGCRHDTTMTARHDDDEAFRRAWAGWDSRIFPPWMAGHPCHTLRARSLSLQGKGPLKRVPQGRTESGGIVLAANAGPRVPSGGVTLKRRCTYRLSVVNLIVNKLLSLSLSLSQTQERVTRIRSRSTPPAARHYPHHHHL